MNTLADLSFSCVDALPDQSLSCVDTQADQSLSCVDMLADPSLSWMDTLADPSLSFGDTLAYLSLSALWLLDLNSQTKYTHKHLNQTFQSVYNCFWISVSCRLLVFFYFTSEPTTSKPLTTVQPGNSPGGVAGNSPVGVVTSGPTAPQTTPPMPVITGNTSALYTLDVRLSCNVQGSPLSIQWFYKQVYTPPLPTQTVGTFR